VRLSPDGQKLLVALSGSAKAPQGQGRKPGAADRSADGIGVVDLALHRVVRVLPSGQDPETFDLSPDGRLLFISNEETAEASIIETATGRLHRTIPTGGEPEGVATRPDGKVVYVTSELASQVVVIDTASEAVVGTFPAGTRPRGIAFLPDGSRAFVTAELGGTVTIVDAQRHVPLLTVDLRPKDLASLGPTGQLPMPMGVTVAPDGRAVYDTTGRGRGLVVLDPASGHIERTLDDVGPRPWGVGVTPDGAKVYTANGPSGDVSVIDARTLRIVKRIPVGRSPWGVVVAR
jgi:YVTN family beta-propeller protein